MSNGGALVSKSYRSFSVNDNLVAKVVAAITQGDINARKHGKIQSFEVFIYGNRQNLIIGQVMVIPAMVADSIDTFPVALLYGAMCQELSPEANAEILNYKLGESEYDEYRDKDLADIKDRLFKDAQGKYRSIVLFLPAWANPRNYVLFKFVKDANLLAMFVRHQIFAAYYDPALSSSFDQLLTNLDTSKMDVTDVTPKLNYPFLAESPFKSYPNLRDDDEKVDVKTAAVNPVPASLIAQAAHILFDIQMGTGTSALEAIKALNKALPGVNEEDRDTILDSIRALKLYEDHGSEDWLARAASNLDDYLSQAKTAKYASTPKVFFSAALTDDVTKEFLEPGERKTLDALTKDLKKSIDGEVTEGVELKTGEDNEGLRSRPDYGSPESHSVDMNNKNKSAAEKVQTYPAWKRKIKSLHPDAVFEGSVDTCQAFADDTKKKGVGEWEGSYGEVYKAAASKKADSVAEDTDPDTSSIGKDVSTAVGTLPAVVDAISLVAKTAGADTKYEWTIVQVGRESWKWSITKKGLGGKKTVESGTADTQKLADAECKKALDKLQGRTDPPSGTDPRFNKKEAANMDDWIAKGLGLHADQQPPKVASAKMAKVASEVKEKPVVEVDGCTLEKIENPARKKVPGSTFNQYIYQATNPEGVTDSPAFDGARMFWGKPEEFPAGFRIAVEKFFKDIHKKAKKMHVADVPLDIDDIWSETMEDLGPAPVAEVKETGKGESPESPKAEDKKDAEPAKEPASSEEPTAGKDNEGAAQEDKKDTESKTASTSSEVSRMTNADVDFYATNPRSPEEGEAARAEYRNRGLSANLLATYPDSIGIPESKTATKHLCDYCGSQTNNVTRICDGCESDMECDICNKRFADTPNDGSWTEIRPDIFAHESCIKKAKTAFNMYIPGQVLENFYPELNHEVVQHPDDSNSPMIDNGVLEPGPGYISTSPSSAMGLGDNGKPEVLEGAPLKQPGLIRGPQFTDEFYQQYETLDPSAIRAASVLKVMSKKAGKEENKAQFIDFLKKVVGEVTASFLAAFKATSRGILTEVPGVGEINLEQVEQPSLIGYNQVNTGSRVRYLLSKMNQTDILDALNEAWAQASVHNDSPNGGFVYEVFVRGQELDPDSMILTYEFVTGSKGV